MGAIFDNLIPDELLNLPRIRRKILMPSRPSMPVGDLSYPDWLAKHRDKLIRWFKECYQRDYATDEEWSDYCRAQFNAEIECERSAKEWLS